MPIALANSIEIAYETFGEPQKPGLVLITGLGEQMVAWPEEFCRLLAEGGFFVIRLDNRDTGLSTKLDALGFPCMAIKVKSAVAEFADALFKNENVRLAHRQRAAGF